MSAPRVSVVLPVLNGAARLAEALASIAAQTAPAAEVLVVDGGSADGSAEIAAGTAGVRLLRQEGPALADAYNTGIAAARGTHLAFQSADDAWRADKLERQLARLAADPPADAVVGLVEFVVEPGDLPPPGFRPGLLEAPRPARIPEALLAPRSVFERVGSFRAAADTAADVDWFARAQDLGIRMAVVPAVVLRKRVHGGSTAHTAAGAQAGLLAALHGSVLRKRAGLQVP